MAPAVVATVLLVALTVGTALPAAVLLTSWCPGCMDRYQGAFPEGYWLPCELAGSDHMPTCRQPLPPGYHWTGSCRVVETITNGPDGWGSVRNLACAARPSPVVPEEV